MRTTARHGIVRVLSQHAFLIIICLAALYPLWFIVSTALRSNAAYQLDPTGFPSHPTFGSLRNMLFHQPLPRWMWNSFLVTVSSVATSTFFALLAAYAAVFGRFRGHSIFVSTSVALMVVPPVTLLVPMFVFMVDTGLVNHLQSVIIFYTGLLVPFAIFFMSSFFRTIPQELIEAASSEGAGPFTVFRRIVLPLSGAASFTLIVVQAIWVWNELLIALVFLQNESSRTLMAGLTQFQGRFDNRRTARPRGCAPLDSARGRAVPIRAALLRARADGRYRQVTRPARGGSRRYCTSKKWKLDGSTVSSSGSPTRAVVAGLTRAVKRESLSARIVVSSSASPRVSKVMRGAATRKKTCESEPSSSSTSGATSTRGRWLRREDGIVERLGADPEHDSRGAAQADDDRGERDSKLAERDRRLRRWSPRRGSSRASR